MYSHLNKNILLSNGLRILRRSISRQFVKFSILEGREHNSQQPISVLYAGNKLNKNYFEKLIFGESCAKTKKIRIWKNRSLQYISDAKSNHDLSIIMSYEIPETTNHEANMYQVPNWVGGELDLLNQAKTKQHREKIRDDKRRVLKNRFNYRVTRDPKEFDHFYNTMHKPYITRVFNDHAYIMTYDEMNHALPKCELFYVTQNDQDIAGIIIVYDGNNRVRAWSLGVKDGDNRWVRDGAIVALVHLQKNYLLEKGYSRLHLGAVRPFLGDGALCFKKKRGLELVDHTTESFSIKPLHNCAGVRGFLQNNPFIYLEEEVLKGAIFIPGDKTLLTKDIKQLYHDWYLPGLECLELFDLKAEHRDDHKPRSFGYIDKSGVLLTPS